MRQTFHEGPGVRVSDHKLIKQAMLTALSDDDAHGAELSEKQMLRMFQLIDKDGNGLLSDDEIKIFLKRFALTPVEISGFISEAGGSNGGALSLDLDAFKRLCRAVFHESSPKDQEAKVG